MHADDVLLLCAGKVKMWDFVDKAYVITLDSATHRHDRLQHAFDDAQIPEKKRQVVKVPRHPKSGAAGCWQSHVAVVDYARHDGCNVALVLEDDFKFTPDFASYLPYVADFVRTMPRDSWDFLMLGVFPVRSEKAGEEVPASLRPYFHKVRCAWQTHAYLVNLPVIETGITPRAMTDTDQEIDIRLFCGNVLKSKIYTYATAPKQRGSVQGPHERLYNTYALMPQIVTQAYDGTSSAGKLDRVVMQTLEKPKFVRAMQHVSLSIDTPSFLYMSVAATTVVVLLLVGSIVAIVMTCRKHS